MVRSETSGCKAQIICRTDSKTQKIPEPILKADPPGHVRIAVLRSKVSFVSGNPRIQKPLKRFWFLEIATI